MWSRRAALAVALLAAQQWRGNIRELRNAIDGAASAKPG